MPEQQASPSSPQPPPSITNDGQQPPRQDETAPPPPESVKRTYLSLLPPSQLIDLILAIDANRQTLIFPHDLDSAIKALQRPQRKPSLALPQQTPAAVSVVVKAEPVPTSLPPQPPQQSHTPPVQPPTVQPPQYQPPQYRPPRDGQPVYPFTHTPYYPPPQHSQPQVNVPPPAPPAPPARHPLFTSTPLTRDPNKLPVAHPTPPPVVSSRDDPNAMPSYEEMIVEAIMDVGDGEGTAPKVLFSWMASHYPLQQNFRPSASQALHKALKRGRLEKLGGKYKLDPRWGGGPTTSKRATRRPTANTALSPPPSRRHHPPGPSTGAPAPPATYAYGHPPYGYTPYAHHPSLPPNPYNPAYGTKGIPWSASASPSQMILQGLGGVGASSKAEEMEDDDGVESEDMEGSGTKELDGLDAARKAEMRQSLVRLAKVLKKVARGSEGQMVAV